MVNQVSQHAAGRSCAFELPFEVAERELQGGGAAVGAVAAFLGQVALGKQVVHLRGAEDIAGFHRRLAGHHGQYILENGLGGLAGFAFGQVVQKLADEGGDAVRGDHRRHGLQCERVGSVQGPFDSQAAEQLGVVFQESRLMGCHRDRLGDQHPLRLERAAGQTLLELLVHDALVQRVLVDDQDAIVILRDQVGAVQLNHRRTLTRRRNSQRPPHASRLAETAGRQSRAARGFSTVQETWRR